MAPPRSHVHVMVRVRPMLPRELRHDNAVETLNDKELVVFKPDAEFASVYDSCMGVHSTQKEVYTQLQGSLLSAIEGYNATVFAYGQTGTGKTHTMMGPPELDLAAAAAGPPAPGQTSAAWETMGVIPRTLADLFKLMRQRREREGVRVTLAASYCEIYNDRLYDLLQPYKKGLGGRDPADMQQHKALLEVREDKAGTTYVPNLLCVKVNSFAGLLTLLAKGSQHKAVRHTEMNITSSRSHAILQLVLEQWPPGSENSPAKGKASTVLRSKLNFVDLAGSERWNKEVDMGADRVNEMTAINGSLSALATVVSALTEGKHRKHVPYRDSKLTHLLQDSLGGNCHTSIIATISPGVDAFDESVSTLKFADRARAIGNNPVVNTSRDLGSVLALKEREIQRLRQLLATYMEGAEAGAAAPTGQGQGQGQGQGEGTAALSITTLGDTSQLLAELDTLRRALDLERGLRTELEARLQRASSSAPSTAQRPGSARALLSEGPGVLTPSVLALMEEGGQQQKFNYLRVSTPPPGTSSGPESPALTAPRTGGSGQRGASGDPFRAVLNRRAQLGLSAGGVGASVDRGGGQKQYTRIGMGGSLLTGLSSPYGYTSGSNVSPVRRAISSLTSPAQHASSWAPAGVRSPTSSPPRQRPTGSGQSQAARAAAMEDTLRSIREQVLQLTLLEQQNKAKALQLAVANRAGRAGSGSPLRRQARLRSAYGSTATLKAGIVAPPAHHAAAPASPPSNDTFSQLLASAHASVHQSPLAAVRAGPYGAGPPPAAPPAYGGATAVIGAGAWGRSAFVGAPPSPEQQPQQPPIAAQPSEMGQQGGGVPQAWGRSSLGSAAAPPPSSFLMQPGVLQPGSLSAPSSAGGGGGGVWGRSALLGGGTGSVASPIHVQESPPSYGSRQPASGGRYKPPSPGRGIDKGSMIYMMGSSISSIKAKAMANSGW